MWIRRQLLALVLLIGLGCAPALALNCVQFVRANSDFALQGNAWMWWSRAAGRYERGQEPENGAVLVFARSGRMVHGHVALVESQLDARTIIINHANWDDRRGYKGRVDLGIRVIDVSANNDWTAVRVWHPKYRNFGRVYPAKGFIYPRLKEQPALIEASYQRQEAQKEELLPAVPPRPPARINRQSPGTDLINHQPAQAQSSPFAAELMMTGSANLIF